MKKGIHPKYQEVVFMDTTTGFKFLSGSTKFSKETIEFEGNTYPLIRVETSADSHPFYTGKAKFQAADGRIARFNKKNMENNKQRKLFLFYREELLLFFLLF